MGDYSELKRLAETAYPGPWYVENGMDQVRDNADDFVCETGEDEPINSAFIAAANPTAVLALIAENERLSSNGLGVKLEVFEIVCADRDQLKTENERLRADYAGLAKFNPEWDRVAAAQDSVREHMAMVVQFKAEVAGLRTGYEAYEQVNAELKAEVEGLRKDSESYHLLSFCHGQGTLELVRSHHELCAEIRRLKILAGEPVPPTTEEFVGPGPEGPTARIRRKLAAMGKGEQS